MVFAVIETLTRAVGDVRTLAHSHGGWMVWNLVLAFVPVVLALVLFRAGIVRSRLWWFGVVLFVLFLPNAPYVITDVVHLFSDIRTARSDLQILGEFIPLYTVFFAIGFGCYVAALDRLHGYLASDAPQLSWWKVEYALHGLCAVGLYLGRVLRFNSWDVFMGPQHLLGSLDILVGPFPIALIVVTFFALIVGSWLTRAVRDAFVRGVRRVALPFRPTA